jgi:hypothetical protein
MDSPGLIGGSELLLTCPASVSLQLPQLQPWWPRRLAAVVAALASAG